MTDVDSRLREFVGHLRSQANEYEECACTTALGYNFELKMVSIMYAYREIADEMEKEFLLWNSEL